jgi:hypothetical protein
LPVTVPERLQQLAECAEYSGRGARWKWTTHKRGREVVTSYMPGWCNGSAGFVFLWTLAHRLLQDETYLILAQKAAWNTWEEHATIDNLCCGLAGRAYGLLNLYKYTGERAWLQRAQELASRAALSRPALELPEHSLYKGKVGVAVLAADLSRPEASSMPLFEEEGWTV